MKSLQERLLDTEDNLLDDMDETMVLDKLKQIYSIWQLRDIKIKNGKIYIDGSLIVREDTPTLELPGITLEEVSGTFDCSFCHSLRSLKGAPTKCRSFSCANDGYLSTLEGGPKEVSGNYDCSHCQRLMSLEGAPKEIIPPRQGNIYCEFNCAGCVNLKSLKYAPRIVMGNFNCSDCKITSLKDGPKKIYGKFYCNDCYLLSSLKYAPEGIDYIYVRGCDSLSDYGDIPDNMIKG